jgi:hypothetical protein
MREIDSSPPAGRWLNSGEYSAAHSGNVKGKFCGKSSRHLIAKSNSVGCHVELASVTHIGILP